MLEASIRVAHCRAPRKPSNISLLLDLMSIGRWLIFKIVDIIRFRAVQHKAVIASGIITNVFIIISVLSAFPWVRK